jgi:hypothetical protein
VSAAESIEGDSYAALFESGARDSSIQGSAFAAAYTQ